MQKMPVNDDLYAFQRTKMPKWSGELNDLKVVLGKQKLFSAACPNHGEVNKNDSFSDIFWMSMMSLWKNLHET